MDVLQNCRASATRARAEIRNPLVKTPSPLKLKLVLSGSNVVSSLSVSKSLYSISNLPSLNSLRCNYDGQLSDDVIFVLTLISCKLYNVETILVQNKVFLLRNILFIVV